MSNYHTSVLLQEAISFLDIKKGNSYIDATLGGGGHTEEILKNGGKVLGIDVDEDAINYVKDRFNNSPQLVLDKGNFKDIDNLARINGFDKASGILFDLGISSYQVDTAERGFSFQKMGSLDMRMDKDLGVKASDLINILPKGELYELFNKFGEERYARALATAIVSARKIKPITTTYELTEIVESVVPMYNTKIHRATKTFQALRMAVNSELSNIEEALPKAINLLDKKGHLVVISFHSLEDRIVKHAFKDFEKKGIGKIITKKPIEPTEEEIEKNNRSRSAKLRVIEKI